MASSQVFDAKLSGCVNTPTMTHYIVHFLKASVRAQRSVRHMTAQCEMTSVLLLARLSTDVHGLILCLPSVMLSVQSPLSAMLRGLIRHCMSCEQDGLQQGWPLPRDPLGIERNG